MGISWLRRNGAIVLVPNVISVSINTGKKSFGAFDVRGLEGSAFWKRNRYLAKDIVDKKFP